MISVIIPSLMRIERIYRTLIELSNCETVGEIILIDNSENTKPLNLPKLVHICEGVNTYINPAWNKGAKIAKFDKLCFLNDDVWFDWSYLEKIDPFISKDRGFIGMSTSNYKDPNPEFTFDEISPNGEIVRGHRPVGFACCFFVYKENWDPIPDDIKLWAGDDWIFYRSPNPNYAISGLKIEGKLSATLDDPELEVQLGPIKTQDMMNMKKYINLGLVPNYFLGTIWQ
jgi:hypothetical protein